MRQILSALLNIAQRTGRLTIAEATAIYNGLWMLLFVAGTSVVGAFLMNAFFDWRTPSLVLAIVFAVATIYLWWKPLHILFFASTGGLWGVVRRIVADGSVATEVEEALNKYLSLLKWVLLAGVTLLFIVGTLPFKENPSAMLPFVVSLIVMALLTMIWPEIFKGTIMRRVVYVYALVVMEMSITSLIPGVVWMKYTGWDPNRFKLSGVESELYKLHKTEREIADQSRAREIARITEKVKRGENLSEAEKQIVKDATESTLRPEEKKPREVAQATTGKLCWQETEKGTGWRKDVKNEKGCFGAKILENEKTHLLVKYKTKDGHGTCDWDKLKDPQYGEWKEVGRNNGGNCMLTQVSRELFTGWFESHYDTKGRHIPGYRDKYFVELRLN